MSARIDNMTFRDAWIQIFGPNVDPWQVAELLRLWTAERRLKRLDEMMAQAGLSEMHLTHGMKAKLVGLSRERVTMAGVRLRDKAA